MKKALRYIASTMLVFGIAAGIAACGGGSASTPAAPDTSGSSAVVALKITDTLVGTGATAVKNNSLTVHYTGWLYDVKASDLHGTKFDSSAGKAPYPFTLGVGSVIKGWDQGVEGMKVGGKRTLIIPSSLGYGASGFLSIPGNAALVFDVELISVQ
ncbi:MAG: FKBP-type peptidyl-prolyl cis-trans isomerase [Pseudomonadota bacterium]